MFKNEIPGLFSRVPFLERIVRERCCVSCYTRGEEYINREHVLLSREKEPSRKIRRQILPLRSPIYRPTSSRLLTSVILNFADPPLPAK